MNVSIAKENPQDLSKGNNFLQTEIETTTINLLLRLKITEKMKFRSSRANVMSVIRHDEQCAHFNDY